MAFVTIFREYITIGKNKYAKNINIDKVFFLYDIRNDIDKSIFIVIYEILFNFIDTSHY